MTDDQRFRKIEERLDKIEKTLRDYNFRIIQAERKSRRF